MNDPAATSQLNYFYRRGEHPVTRLLVKAVLSGQSINGVTSHALPLPESRGPTALAEWRSCGQTPTVTPKTFAQARRKLSLALSQKGARQQRHPTRPGLGVREQDKSLCGRVFTARCVAAKQRRTSRSLQCTRHARRRQRACLHRSPEVPEPASVLFETLRLPQPWEVPTRRIAGP